MDSDSESKLISLISKLLYSNNRGSEDQRIIKIISQVASMDLELQPKPLSEFMSLVTQAISVFKSMDLDSQPEPLSKLISLIAKKLSQLNSRDLDLGRGRGLEVSPLAAEIWSLTPEPELVSIINQIMALFLPTVVEQESEFMYDDSFISEWEPEFMPVDRSMDSEEELEFLSVDSSMDPEEEIVSADSSMESKLISLIYQLQSFPASMEESPESDMSGWMQKLISFSSVIRQLISLISSLDLDSHPESGAISLISQIISVANSTSRSEPEWEFISLVNQFIFLIRSLDPEQEPPMHVMLHMVNLGSHLLSVNPNSKLGSLIAQLLSFNPHKDTEPEWELGQLISLSPQSKVQLLQGKFHVTKTVERKNKEKGKCQPGNRRKVYLAKGEEATHFLCKDCNGEDHEECQRTPVEVQHPLHPKHSLQLVSHKSSQIQTRKCFCCEEDLQKFFYYCSACDYSMNIACVDKQPVLSIYHPKWHQHKLHWFPRRAFLTCNLCALDDISSPTYMCPSCDFVVHLRCIKLPRVIRISRHPHRISFTPSFDQKDWSCGVCRKGIENDYGGYSCIKDGCLYGTHSRCATQRNVWDGRELEGVPEEIEEEELEPYVTIGKGIIQHFSHDYAHHHLRLDENTSRDYDDNKQCHACIMPIYFGSFYSCVKCNFILHEECANLSRKIHNPIHPHLLTLVGGCDNAKNDDYRCSACPWWCTSGFFYKCSKGCRFKLHVQCATISEPLNHGSHEHPLYLTSKPEERRACSVCKNSRLEFTNETFNCIESDFALCFLCATLPQKVMYKHDKHALTLSYADETRTMTYWCEVCERIISPKERFYICDEYCGVILHLQCLLGMDLYLKPGSYFYKDGQKVRVLANNRMTRPFCIKCRMRCPYKVYLQTFPLTYCTIDCI